MLEKVRKKYFSFDDKNNKQQQQKKPLTKPPKKTWICKSSDERKRSNKKVALGSGGKKDVLFLPVYDLTRVWLWHTLAWSHLPPSSTNTSVLTTCEVFWDIHPFLLLTDGYQHFLISGKHNTEHRFSFGVSVYLSTIAGRGQTAVCYDMLMK